MQTPGWCVNAEERRRYIQVYKQGSIQYMNHEPGVPHIWGQRELATGKDNGAQDEQRQVIEVYDIEGSYAVGLTIWFTCRPRIMNFRHFWRSAGMGWGERDWILWVTWHWIRMKNVFRQIFVFEKWTGDFSHRYGQLFSHALYKLLDYRFLLKCISFCPRRSVYVEDYNIALIV